MLPSATISAATRKKSLSYGLWRISQGPVLWLIPLALVLVTFFLYPALEVVRISFTNSDMISNTYHYTFNSYIRMFTDASFYNMIWITFFFVSFSVIFQFLLGFIIALTVDKGEHLRMKGTVVARTVALVSWSIPGVVIGIIWNILYNESPSGIINYLISFVGIGPVPFFTSPVIALFAISVANVWRGTAQSMILLYAGLKTIPMDVIEAANVDGANSWRKLLSVIIPSIRPVIVINILLNIINTFNTFDMIMSLTGGGPGRSTEVLVLSSYTTIFQLLDLGKGSAIAVLLLLINVVMSVIYISISKEGVST